MRLTPLLCMTAIQKSATEHDPLLKEGDFSGVSEAERTTQEFWDLIDETIDKVNKFYMEQVCFTHVAYPCPLTG